MYRKVSQTVLRSPASLWTVAFLVTFATATYQRITGPTYPLSGGINLGGAAVQYSLPRSHGGSGPALIEIVTRDSTVRGFVQWKRYKTNDTWIRTTMVFHDGVLASQIPNQPPAGKVLYSVALSRGNEVAVVPGDDPLIIRFKGDVPLGVLIPHVLVMFLSMLFAARAGLEYFQERPRLKSLMVWTVVLLAVGGFILGPVVQKYAFNAYWTGWPYGTDLTDNKTAVALLAWIAALIAYRKAKNPKLWAFVAAIVTFVVFLIPHSLLGSELDYGKVGQSIQKVDTTIAR